VTIKLSKLVQSSSKIDFIQLEILGKAVVELRISVYLLYKTFEKVGEMRFVK